MKDKSIENKRWSAFAVGDKEMSAFSAAQVDLTPGERLKDLLEERGMTQQELAHITNLSTGTISNLINGKDMGRAKASTLVTIAYYLDISVDWLLGLTQANNMTRDDTVKQLSEHTGFSDKAITALIDSIDYHEKGYDYEYGSVLGYILDNFS